LNDKAPDLKEYFKPEFAKGLVSSGNKIDISYPNSSSGKYIALYGFEELLQYLPDNITEFGFVNKSSQKLAWDIPASIGKFKELTMLQLDGIVNTLPDEIGNLSNLFMLVLSNNKNLKSLPPSIGKLDSLVVLNLMGCDKDLFGTLPEDVQKQFSTESHAEQFYVHNTN
jgi:Leucine-rich repeat (LRR) protein